MKNENIYLKTNAKIIKLYRKCDITSVVDVSIKI